MIREIDFINRDFSIHSITNSNNKREIGDIDIDIDIGIDTDTDTNTDIETDTNIDTDIDTDTGSFESTISRIIRQAKRSIRAEGKRDR